MRAATFPLLSLAICTSALATACPSPKPSEPATPRTTDPPAAPPIVEAGGEPVPKPVCRPAWAEQDMGSISNASFAQGELRFRVDESDEHFLNLILDLKSGTFREDPNPPPPPDGEVKPAPPPSDAWPRYTLEATAARVCRSADDCFDALGGTTKKPLEVMAAGLSVDGSTVAVLATESVSDTQPRVSIWDVKTSKRRTSFAVGDENYLCTTTGLALVTPNRIAVNLDVCAGPGGAFHVYDTKGKELFVIGQGEEPASAPNSYGMNLYPIGGDRWVLMDSSAESVVVQNLATGAIERRISVVPFDESSDEVYPIFGPDQSTMIPIDDGRFAAILGANLTGDVAIIDPAKPKVERWYQLASCPKGSGDEAE